MPSSLYKATSGWPGRRLDGSAGGPASEQRQAGQGAADELMQMIDGRRHHPAGAGVAEDPLDAELAREGGAAAGLHREIGDRVGRLQRRQSALQDEERCRLARLLEMIERVAEQGAR